MTKYKKVQINNLQIAYSKAYEKWQVRHGDKIYEEFESLEAAKQWARETRDFIKKR
jgi:hypothetical protein